MNLSKEMFEEINRRLADLKLQVVLKVDVIQEIIGDMSYNSPGELRYVIEVAK